MSYNISSSLKFSLQGLIQKIFQLVTILNQFVVNIFVEYVRVQKRQWPQLLHVRLCKHLGRGLKSEGPWNLSFSCFMVNLSLSLRESDYCLYCCPQHSEECPAHGCGSIIINWIDKVLIVSPFYLTITCKGKSVSNNNIY